MTQEVARELVLNKYNLSNFVSSFSNMLVRIFETPVLDVLLIVLAIRFIWPGLFGIRKRSPSQTNNHQQRNFVNEPPPVKNSKVTDKRGEYIDYEEIK